MSPEAKQKMSERMKARHAAKAAAKSAVNSTIPVAKTSEQVAEESPINQFVGILSDLAKQIEGVNRTIEGLGTRLTALEVKPPAASFSLQAQTPVFQTNTPTNIPDTAVSVSASVPSFFTQVPQDILTTATQILGEKFTFEVQSLKDRPSFEFTIIVPAEYSQNKNEADRRTRVISNAEGINGVSQWCQLVKQHVIKFLGTQVIHQ